MVNDKYDSCLSHLVDFVRKKKKKKKDKVLSEVLAMVCIWESHEVMVV